MKKILFIITLFIFSIGFCCLTNTTPDNDIWARLIAGWHVVEKLSILKQDFLSYTPTHTWYDHEWGASVIFYLVLKYFGVNGLIILKGILAALTLFFCYKTVEIRKPHSTTAYNILYFALMLFVVSRSLGAVIRCLLFTCLFFAIFIYILERYRQKGGKCLFLLPFLMILWSNIHGGCISAFGLLGIYIIGEFLNKKPFKPYVYTSLGCLAALFINPYGFNYVKFLFYAAFMDRGFITEWLSPFHNHYLKDYLRYKFYLGFIIFIQIIYLIKNKINYEKMDKTKILLVLATIYLSLTHLRHITFFVFTAGTLMYDEFYWLFNEIINKIKPKNEEFNNSFILAKEIIVYFFLIILTLPVIISNNKEVRITETAYPRYAVEFIKINELKGNLLISFDWGSYAAYKLYPNNLISMDGRYEEVYNPDLLTDIKNFHMLRGNWDKIIKDYKTDVIIVEKKYPVYDKLSGHPEWKKVFENNLSAVFIPVSNPKEKYLYPVPDDDYYNKMLFATNIK